MNAGFTVDVFNRNKIEALRMGGLPAVNKGSVYPPAFSVLEWKPGNWNAPDLSLFEKNQLKT
jgi:leucyl aminopeptidase